MRIKDIFRIGCILALLSSPVYASGWGSGGAVQTDLGGTEVANVVVVQPDGKVLAAGQTDDDMVVVRYNTNGTLDNTFGTGGVSLIQYPLGWSVANDMKVLSSGKILVLGTTFNSSTRDVALVRLNINGTLDSSFAGGGKIRTDFGALENYGVQLLIGSGGEIFVLEGENRTAVHKYSSEGVLITSFGTNGVLNYSSSLVASGFAFADAGSEFYFLCKASDDDMYLYKSAGNGLVSPLPIRDSSYFSWGGGDSSWIKSSDGGNIAFLYEVNDGVGRLFLKNDDYHLGALQGAPINVGAPKVGFSNSALTWMNDNALIYGTGSNLWKINVGGTIDTTFGIGGKVSTGKASSDLAAYDTNRVIQLATASDDFYLAVYNADGSPYVDTPPAITSPTTVNGAVQEPVEYVITASNNPTSFDAIDLPPDLSLDTSSGTPKIVGTPTEAGTFISTVSATNSGGTGDAQVTFEIAKTAQTITFTNPGAQVLGALPFSADAVSTSGLPVVVSATSGPVTVIDNTIYLTGEGLATLVASQTGSDDFAPADDVSISFSIVLAGESPTVLTNPTDGISTAGASAVFAVTASGPQPYQYQWLKNGATMDGQTSSVLVLNGVGYFDEAEYSCRVSNSFGNTTSTAASLNVTADPNALDSDGDGISDPLETYLAPFGLDPNVDSTAAWERLQAMVSEQGLGDGYTAEQMRDLALGAPVIQRAENGNFTLRMDLLTSNDLQTWDSTPLETGDVGVEEGAIDVTLNPSDQDVQFYRITAEGDE